MTADVQWKRIGEILVADGVCPQWQVDDALAAQRSRPDTFLGQILVEMGAVDGDTLRTCLEKQVVSQYRDHRAPE